MSVSRWTEIERLYHQAALLNAEGRREFLAQACAGDEELKREVESLLAHDTVEDFLERPAMEFAAPDLAEAEVFSLQPGDQIGAYKILCQVGRGGMGMVYRAEQQYPIRREVALKVIKPGMDTEQLIARFEAERQALAMMNHPNIARVLDAGTTGAGRLYFVMELVDGPPITEYCADLDLGLREKLNLFVSVCRAIQHAHQKGVIHRDIKPSNILVAAFDGEPVVKVIDFGIAKTLVEPLTERSMHTQAGAVIGTLEYMSPEQAESAGVDIDTRCDVYSLGAVLYQLITGRPPIERVSHGVTADYEMVQRIREEEPPSPSSRIKDPKLAKLVRGDLDWVVMKAIAKDRTRRYGATSELADDLENYLSGRPVTVGPPSRVYRLTKVVRHYRVELAAVSAFVLLLVGATAFSAREAIRARKAEQSAAAVNDFLQNGLLAQVSANVQASSNVRPDRDLKMRTALDRASQRIGGTFAGQPEVEASLRQTIGSTYLDLGLYSEARKQLQRAVDLRSAALGDHAPATLDSRNLLAVALLKEGKLREAERLGNEVLAVRRSVSGERDPATLTALNNFAAIQLAEGKDILAQQLFSQVAEERRQVLGARHPDTLKSMNNLGVVLVRLEKFSQAEQLLSQVLKTRREVLGGQHPETMDTRSDLAHVYNESLQAEKAVPLERDVLAWQRRVLGPAHSDTLNTQLILGISLSESGQFLEGDPLLRGCAQTAAQSLGAESATALACLNNLANSLCAQGKFTEAEPIYRDLMAADIRARGPEDSNTLRSMSNLAIVLDLEGRYQEAEAMFDKVVALRKRILGPKHPKTLSSMDARAALLEHAGRLVEAETAFKEVTDLRREVLGPQHQNTRYSMVSLAEVLLTEKKFPQAETLLGELNTPTKLDEEPWFRALCQSLWGESLMGERRYPEAEPLLKNGYAEMRATHLPLLHRPELRGEVDRARQRLIMFYRVQGLRVPAELKTAEVPSLVAGSQ